MSDDLDARQGRVVRFHYEMRDESGAVVESSRQGDPLAILLGRGVVLPSIEEALTGRVIGDRFEVTLTPERAYGPRREGAHQRVSKKYFRDPARLKAGMVAQLSTEKGTRPVTVLKVGSKIVDVDLNHPQAGRTLTFDLEVMEVRESTPEEIAHGHVHGPGGHAH
jgi:FKBP-type peptidyl-prolyl cis-trans isomerase SlyD